ncbi:unnamed protein product [Closterium sp. Naga37s-1]|nr:unnamed protein product [Closterium sp. Naga37s-1]
MWSNLVSTKDRTSSGREYGMDGGAGEKRVRGSFEEESEALALGARRAEEAGDEQRVSMVEQGCGWGGEDELHLKWEALVLDSRRAEEARDEQRVLTILLRAMQQQVGQLKGKLTILLRAMQQQVGQLKAGEGQGQGEAGGKGEGKAEGGGVAAGVAAAARAFITPEYLAAVRGQRRGGKDGMSLTHVSPRRRSSHRFVPPPPLQISNSLDPLSGLPILEPLPDLTVLDPFQPLSSLDPLAFTSAQPSPPISPWAVPPSPWDPTAMVNASLFSPVGMACGAAEIHNAAERANAAAAVNALPSVFHSTPSALVAAPGDLMFPGLLTGIADASAAGSAAALFDHLSSQPGSSPLSADPLVVPFSSVPVAEPLAPASSHRRTKERREQKHHQQQQPHVSSQPLHPFATLPLSIQSLISPSEAGATGGAGVTGGSNRRSKNNTFGDEGEGRRRSTGDTARRDREGATNPRPPPDAAKFLPPMRRLLADADQEKGGNPSFQRWALTGLEVPEDIKDMGMGRGAGEIKDVGEVGMIRLMEHARQAREACEVREAREAREAVEGSGWDAGSESSGIHGMVGRRRRESSGTGGGVGRREGGLGSAVHGDTAGRENGREGEDAWFGAGGGAAAAAAGGKEGKCSGVLIGSSQGVVLSDSSGSNASSSTGSSGGFQIGSSSGAGTSSSRSGFQADGLSEQLALINAQLEQVYLEEAYLQQAQSGGGAECREGRGGTREEQGKAAGVIGWFCASSAANRAAFREAGAVEALLQLATADGGDGRLGSPRGSPQGSPHGSPRGSPRGGSHAAMDALLRLSADVESQERLLLHLPLLVQHSSSQMAQGTVSSSIISVSASLSPPHSPPFLASHTFLPCSSPPALPEQFFLLPSSTGQTQQHRQRQCLALPISSPPCLPLFSHLPLFPPMRFPSPSASSVPPPSQLPRPESAASSAPQPRSPHPTRTLSIPLFSPPFLPAPLPHTSFPTVSEALLLLPNFPGQTQRQPLPRSSHHNPRTSSPSFLTFLSHLPFSPPFRPALPLPLLQCFKRSSSSPAAQIKLSSIVSNTASLSPHARSQLVQAGALKPLLKQLAKGASRWAMDKEKGLSGEKAGEGETTGMGCGSGREARMARQAAAEAVASLSLSDSCCSFLLTHDSIPILTLTLEASLDSADWGTTLPLCSTLAALAAFSQDSPAAEAAKARESVGEAIPSLVHVLTAFASYASYASNAASLSNGGGEEGRRSEEAVRAVLQALVVMAGCGEEHRRSMRSCGAVCALREVVRFAPTDVQGMTQHEELWGRVCSAGGGVVCSDRRAGDGE